MTSTIRHRDSIPKDEVLESGALKKSDLDEKPTQLKPEKVEAKVQECRNYPDTSTIRLIPVFTPTSASKLSLLEEFRLLRAHRVSLKSSILHSLTFIPES